MARFLIKLGSKIDISSRLKTARALRNVYGKMIPLTSHACGPRFHLVPLRTEREVKTFLKVLRAVARL